MFLCQQCSPYVSSSESTVTQKTTDGMIRHWCTVSWPWSSDYTYFEVFLGLLSTIYSILSNLESIFLLAVMSREVDHIPMDLKHNICNCSHRNIKLLGGGIIAFTFDTLVCTFSIPTIFPFVFSGPCSVWCTKLY